MANLIPNIGLQKEGPDRRTQGPGSNEIAIDEQGDLDADTLPALSTLLPSSSIRARNVFTIEENMGNSETRPKNYAATLSKKKPEVGWAVNGGKCTNRMQDTPLRHALASTPRKKGEEDDDNLHAAGDSINFSTHSIRKTTARLSWGATPSLQPTAPPTATATRTNRRPALSAKKEAKAATTSIVTRSSRQQHMCLSATAAVLPMEKTSLRPALANSTEDGAAPQKLRVSAFKGRNSEGMACFSTPLKRSATNDRVESVVAPMDVVGIDLDGESDRDEEEDLQNRVDILKDREVHHHHNEMVSSGPLSGKTTRKRTTRTSKQRNKAAASIFILNQAACNDEHEDENEGLIEDDEDEDTDLSGFIVDDGADLSFYSSESGLDSGNDVDLRCLERDSSNRAETSNKPKRKLVRGSRTRQEERSVEKYPGDELGSLTLKDEKEQQGEAGLVGRIWEHNEDELAQAIATIELSSDDHEEDWNIEQSDRFSKRSAVKSKGEIEIIDLTLSPHQKKYSDVQAPNLGSPTTLKPKHYSTMNFHDKFSREKNKTGPSSPPAKDGSSEIADQFILSFSPPNRKTPTKADINTKSPFVPPVASNEAKVPISSRTIRSKDSQTATTPPQTPPGSSLKLRSPTKINSPNKSLLISPIRRGTQIVQSPHRQSIDAFWSSEVINEWNDEYSPAKPPLTVSPKKRWKNWKIWEDEGDLESPSEGDGSSEHGADESLSSPSASPSRGKARSPTKTKQKTRNSPSKSTRPFIISPNLATQQKKKAALATKKKFDVEKVNIACDCLRELDQRVSDGQLARLSHSTGGVKIIWSKNLRSTAGRANWRRTVTKKPTSDADSPTKGTDGYLGMAEEMDKSQKVLVQHFASIELAEKVIDTEEKLVNTLAHEYCHLANFMVSGVKDQPHGASFKRW